MDDISHLNKTTNAKSMDNLSHLNKTTTRMHGRFQTEQQVYMKQTSIPRHTHIYDNKQKRKYEPPSTFKIIKTGCQNSKTSFKRYPKHCIVLPYPNKNHKLCPKIYMAPKETGPTKTSTQKMS